MSEASGHQGLWTVSRYPGDAVRKLAIYRRTRTGELEIGSVEIQQFTSYVKVCMFVPGEIEQTLGDTPKTWPEIHADARNNFEADAIYDRYVQEAYAAGWQNYHPEQHP